MPDDWNAVRQMLDDASAGEPEHGEAELGLLGSAINASDLKSVLWVLNRVDRDDLAFGTSRRLRDALAECVHRGETPDLFTVSDELARQGLLPDEARRLVNRISADALVMPFEWENAVSTIRRHAEKRFFVREVRGALAAVQSGEEEVPDIKARLVSALLKPQTGAGGPVWLHDAVLNEQGRLRQQEAVSVMQSGIPPLDKIAGGLERRQLGIIAGRPGTGKTALAMQVIHWAADRWGPVAFLSLEMGEDQLARRIIASVTDYDYRTLRDCGPWEGGALRYFDEDELDDISRKCRDLAGTKHGVLVDTSAHKMSAVVERLHAYKLEHGVTAAVIDYGQLLTEDRRKTSGKVEEMGLIARALKKEVADPLDMPVWCLVQPNRNSEKREGKRLEMHDLGWSSDWEAAATQIWLLNLDRDYADSPAELGIILDVTKSRNGATGEVPLVFHRPRFRFAGRDEPRPTEGPSRERERWS